MEKVLSSGAVRARVAAAEGRSVVEADLPGGLAEGFWAGAVVRRAGDGLRADAAQVRQSRGNRLTLDRPLGVDAGDLLELRAGVEAPVLAAHLATGTPLGETLPPMAMRLATTRGTNALLERRGGRVAALLSEGLADLLRIGDQTRPDLFALDIRRAEPLEELSIEVRGRLDASGGEVSPLDLGDLRQEAKAALDAGIDCAAVCLMHATANDAHERVVVQMLHELGFAHVRRSSAVSARIGYLARAQSTVIDAYLAPAMESYLAGVSAALGRREHGGAASSLRVMTSAGGLASAEDFHAKDGLLSGPAGGVVGAIAAAKAAGVTDIISFDMGGTSTDVSHAAGGRRTLVQEHRVGEAKVRSAAVAVETVAAGGGSVCWCERGELRVGPHSAGADPGPACYGAGGPLTLTDCNLLLGRIDPARFGVPVDVAAAERALEALARQVAQERTGARDRAHDRRELLRAFLEIADERMAEAIRTVSVRRGHDPSRCTLVAFGGAGPQHACGVAARLGVTRILVPRGASVLSALGVGASRPERVVERQILAPLEEVGPALERIVEAMSAEGAGALGAGAGALRRVELFCRQAGQNATLEIEWTPEADIGDAFAQRHRQVYGHAPTRAVVEVESVRVVVSLAEGDAAGGALPDQDPAAAQVPSPQDAADRWPTHERSRLAAGARVQGPALIVEQQSVTVVAEGWAAVVDDSSALVLAAEDAGAGPPLGTRAARQEIVTHRLGAIAQEMGAQLERSAISVNVKDRLDFSCAILDASGRLVVNAPHVPVHLGGLGLCVRAVAQELPLREGDVALTNHPAFGGTHLPDVTLVCPVHAAGRLVGFVASRAHHAEIGGIRPASMPAGAASLEEEGVVISPRLLVAAGEGRWDDVRGLLGGGRWPSRRIEENLADLQGQLAACERGRRQLAALAEELGADSLERHMLAVQDGAAARMAEVVAALQGLPRRHEERLDDGSVIRLSVDRPSAQQAGGSVAGRRGGARLVVDFAGTSGVSAIGLNATPAIVTSAVIYVLRLLAGRDLPLNEGLLRDVEVRLPPDCLLNPAFSADAAECPPVAGGNVETSQRIVEGLVAALHLAASGQGTMNNIAFGSAATGAGGELSFSFYETVCGGAGATAAAPGAGAVHTHMTNTRITDPEILEHRLPVTLERFAIRRGSGGGGAHHGGDGAVRVLRFAAPAELSVLTQHRTAGPAGLGGGLPGAPGAQRLVRADGEEIGLGAIDSAIVAPGDRLILETPGGGGWGANCDP